MTFEEYQKAVLMMELNSTFIPQELLRISIYELMKKVDILFKKMMNEKVDNIQCNSKLRLKELGDILHHLTILCTLQNFNLEYVAKTDSEEKR